MSLRRLASALIGGWLAGMAMMTLVATHNLGSVDEAARSLGQPQAREILRRYGAELNRSYFEAWEWAQLPLGAAATAALCFAGRGRRWLAIVCAAALAFVAAQRMAITPRMVELSRAVENAPPAPFSAARARFWDNHRLYTGMEVMKAGGLLVVLAFLLRRSRR
jgi:hypothetical protein